MEQKLRTLALILAPLKAKWDFFPGGTEGNGTLETQGFDSTQIIITRSSVRVLENYFSRDHLKNSTPLSNRWGPRPTTSTSGYFHHFRQSSESERVITKWNAIPWKRIFSVKFLYVAFLSKFNLKRMSSGHLSNQ